MKKAKSTQEYEEFKQRYKSNVRRTQGIVLFLMVVFVILNLIWDNLVLKALLIYTIFSYIYEVINCRITMRKK
jgi:hypothetical protein